MRRWIMENKEKIICKKTYNKNELCIDKCKYFCYNLYVMRFRCIWYVGGKKELMLFFSLIKI